MASKQISIVNKQYSDIFMQLLPNEVLSLYISNNFISNQNKKLTI